MSKIQILGYFHRTGKTYHWPMGFDYEEMDELVKDGLLRTEDGPGNSQCCFELYEITQPGKEYLKEKGRFYE